VLLVAESHRRSRQHTRLDRPASHAGTPKAPGSRGGTPRERGEKAYERACGGASTRGAVRAPQACANDHDAPKPGW
jgi:hypothetical protein